MDCIFEDALMLSAESRDVWFAAGELSTVARTEAESVL
jgi:hypothetical protein